MTLTVGSTFSGIGGFDLGLQLAGWHVRWQIENDKFCNKILKRHWPEVTRFGDITTVDPGVLERVDLICGGFPCQDVSVAGNRAGLVGERSGLWFDYLRLVAALRPPWVLIENVPGLLSSNEGQDFQVILEGLAQCGYGVAWRILDSQYFGVPQRRRRVFFVGRLGRPCPPEVLFDPESLSRDSTKGGRAAKDVAGTLAPGANGSGFNGRDAYNGNLVAGPLTASFGRRGHPSADDAARNQIIAHPLLAKGNSSHDDSLETYITGTEAHNGNSDPIADNYVVNARQDPVVSRHVSPAIDSGHPVHAVAIHENQRGELTTRRTLALTTGGGKPGQGYPAILSPAPDPDRMRETSRVSGRLDSREPDGPRYRALGNAVTVPVIEWIGKRIVRYGATQ